MDKALNYLSLARKAGLAELGEEPVGAAARAGKAYVILVASDAGDHTWRRAKAFAAGTDQQCIRLDCTKEEMGFVVGRQSLAIAAITDVRLALAMVEALGEDAKPFIRPNGEKYYVNLKEINALWLRKAGVEHIEISDACTVCQSDLYWSHRVTRGQRGSQGAIIVCGEGLG